MRLLVVLLLLLGCSSVDPKEHQDRRLKDVESRIKHLGVLSDREMVGHTEPDLRQPQPDRDPAVDQWMQPGVSSIDRLKNRLRIMDDSFSSDIQYLREKLQHADRTIAAQAARIKVLEDKQPLIDFCPKKVLDQGCQCGGG